MRLFQEGITVDSVLERIVKLGRECERLRLKLKRGMLKESAARKAAHLETLEKIAIPRLLGLLQAVDFQEEMRQAA